MLPLIAAAWLASAPVADLRQRTTGLEVGESRDLIYADLGPPDKVETQTCGTKTKRPWDCLVWTYEATDSQQYLDIVFVERNGAWIVAGWVL